MAIALLYLLILFAPLKEQADDFHHHLQRNYHFHKINDPIHLRP